MFVKSIAEIFLLSLAGKLYARLIQNRIIKHDVKEIYLEIQCGFMSGSGTIDRISVLSDVPENMRGIDQELYMVFWNLLQIKVFDTVNPGMFLESLESQPKW